MIYSQFIAYKFWFFGYKQYIYTYHEYLLIYLKIAEENGPVVRNDDHLLFQNKIDVP